MRLHNYSVRKSLNARQKFVACGVALKFSERKFQTTPRRKILENPPAARFLPSFLLIDVIIHQQNHIATRIDDRIDDF